MRESGERGGDVGAGGRGDHALAFWFTVALRRRRDMRGRLFLRLKREDELWGCIGSRVHFSSNLLGKKRIILLDWNSC